MKGLIGVHVIGIRELFLTKLLNYLRNNLSSRILMFFHGIVLLFFQTTDNTFTFKFCATKVIWRALHYQLIFG